MTGASRGLGRATAIALAERGMKVVLSAPTLAEAEATVAELDARLGIVARQLDVSRDEQVAALFDELHQQFGRLDVLVNNAGIIPEGPGATALEVPATLVAEALNVNALGPYRTCQRALPWMNEAGYGRIVNVSSGMGALADMGRGTAAYRISKTALHAVTVQFHLEARTGVKVNAVCPGWVQTDLGGASATRSVEQGIVGIIWAATLADDGPSGGFFRDGEPLSW
ncbi:MAG TPA: SDR family NAD(P)-dependent oxidoreductase [Enhygromyxa sp.]|nr:SDR family NAD(P)-dependent oxidoreductase [Enhygromyxa sp.]